MNEILISPLLPGFLLDCLLGDPYRLPHPVRWLGHAIAWGEIRLNKERNRKWKGAGMTIVLTGLVWLVLFFGLKSVESFAVAHFVVSSVLVFYGLANHSLIAEAWNVERRLRSEGLEAGRRQLSYIVGRDTSYLYENQIRTAVLETLAENLSDGVVAPLFFYAIGGIPLMFAYKMVNTLDSMIGYKSERYNEFGWFAARADDWANFIPARLTAFLMVLISLSLRGLRYLFLHGHKHASPNSGYPEAALAGILNVRFGGPNTYHGQLVHKPYIGNKNRVISSRDMVIACILNASVALAVVTLILLLQHFL